MSTTQTPAPQTGIVVSTAIVAGPGSDAERLSLNHAEGIAVSTAIVAGGDQERLSLNHAEGIAVSTAITGGGPGLVLQHAEGIVSR